MLKDDMTKQNQLRSVLFALRSGYASKDDMHEVATLLEECEEIISGQKRAISELIQMLQMLKDIIRATIKERRNG